MPAHLLDINVLIARADADHQHHDRAALWMQRNLKGEWATCPLTENGFIRILGHPSYPGWPGTPQRSALALRKLIATVPGHRFLPDAISILDSSSVSSLKDLNPRALTDVYLLALAVFHGFQFASLDAHIEPRLVTGGPKAYVHIP